MSDVPQSRRKGGAALCHESMRVTRDDEYDSTARHEIRKAEGSPLSRSPPIGRFQLTLNLILGDRQGLQLRQLCSSRCHVLLPRLGSTPWQGWLREHYQKRLPTAIRVYASLQTALFVLVQELAAERAGRMGLRWRTTSTVLAYLSCTPNLSLLERAMLFPIIADHRTAGRQNPTQMCLGGR